MSKNTTSIAMSNGSCTVSKDGYLTISVPVAALLKNTSELTATESGKSLSLSHPVNEQGQFLKFAVVPVQLEDKTVEVCFNFNAFVTNKALEKAATEAEELAAKLAEKQAKQAEKVAHDKAKAKEAAQTKKSREVQQLSYVPPTSPEVKERLDKMEAMMTSIMEYLTK